MDLRVFTEPQQGASHADLRRIAQATRDLGFSAFFRSDHVMAMGPISGLPGPSDSMVSLAALAAEVPEIRLGTLVTAATFRSPGMLAIAAANIDDISRGRLELGMGTGWFEAEHLAYGLPFGSSFGERFDRLAEQLEILTGLWSTPVGKTYSFQGQWYQLSESPALPKPVQRRGDGTPHIPLVLGGKGPKRTPALAARYADEFNVAFTSTEFVASQFERVREACNAAGRVAADVVYSAANVLCVGSSDADINRRASAIGRNPADLRAASPVAGTVDEVLHRLSELSAAGAQRVYLQVLDLSDLDHLELVADRILPNVATW